MGWDSLYQHRDIPFNKLPIYSNPCNWMNKAIPMISVVATWAIHIESHSNNALKATLANAIAVLEQSISVDLLPAWITKANIVVKAIAIVDLSPRKSIYCPAAS